VEVAGKKYGLARKPSGMDRKCFDNGKPALFLLRPGRGTDVVDDNNNIQSKAAPRKSCLVFTSF